jgi:uncharacterized protein YabE (DUF348 family)
VRKPAAGKIVTGVIYGVVTAAVVAGTTAYVTLDKTVHVAVDGKVVDVHSYARSVGQLLDRQGITVGKHDSLLPAASSALHDGETITIKRGRLLNLVVDGDQRQVWVTATSLDDALAQAGMRAPGAELSADRSARVPLDGMSVDINLPHTITVQVDGQSHVIVTTKSTLGEALDEAGIVVNPGDTVSSPLEMRPTDGLAVVIVRVTSGQVQESVQVAFTTQSKNDESLYVGTKKVAQAGKNGTRVRTYQIVYADGKPTSKTLVSDIVAVQPVPQVIAVGTKPKPKPKPRVYPTRADGLNWAALAACESGGRPTAVHGAFYGMYQFRISTWHAVGGAGLPSQASASEQTYRAQLLYQRSNWRTQWPTCGHYLFS